MYTDYCMYTDLNTHIDVQLSQYTDHTGQYTRKSLQTYMAIDIKIDWRGWSENRPWLHLDD